MHREERTPEELRDDAAQPVYERIRQDRERVPTHLAAWLDVVEKNLFDPDLNVNYIKRVTGSRDNSIAVRFHAEVGITPKAYITECRMAVANTLLLETALRVWQISDLLGYSSLGVFSMAFQRSQRLRPKVYRETHARNSEGTPLLLTEGYLSRVLSGLVSQEEGRQIIERLLAAYPTILSKAA